MNRNLMFVLTALSLAGLSLAAEPQPEGKPRPGGFLQQMDKDGDGKVTQAEAGERWERLSKLDKNSDGAVSPDELPAFGPGGPGRPGGPGGPEGPGRMFQFFDKDGDGKITKEEAGERWERLGQMDKNADGTITKDELPSFGGPGGARPNPAEMLARMDTDGDGKISQAEAGDRWQRMSQLDKNGDGAITKDELPSFGAGPGGPRPNPEEWFARTDKDGDGKLTATEVPAELWERISKADADGNGSLTKEELAAARQQAGAGRPKGKAGAGQPPQTPPQEN